MADKKISIAELRSMRAAAKASEIDKNVFTSEKNEDGKKSVFVNRSEKKDGSPHLQSNLKSNNIDQTNQQVTNQTNLENNQPTNIGSYGSDFVNNPDTGSNQQTSSLNNDQVNRYTNYPPAPPKKNIFEDEINIMDYLEIAYRYKFMIILVTIALILAAYIYSINQTPIYKATTKLLINNDIMELKVINQKPVLKEQMKLSTWIQIIESSDVATRVSRYMEGKVSPGAIKASLETSTLRDEERVINLTSTHTNPNIAAQIANYYYYAVNDYDMSIRNDNYAQTIRYLEEQLDRNNRELDSLNVTIENLYRKHNFKNFSGDIEDNFKRLSSFKDILSSTEVELESENANIRALKQRLKEEDSEYTTETTYSEPLKMRLLNLEVDLARALTSYGENHPKVIGIRRNIANITTLIEEGAEQNVQLKSVGNNPLKQQILSDLIKSETKVISLSQRKIALARIIKSMELNPEVSSLLNDLHRQKDALSAIIINLQTQLSEMRLSSSIDAYRIVQLEQAIVPSKPSNNKLKLNLLIGTILGLGLGFGLAMLLNMFDNKIRTVKTLEKEFPAIPIVGLVPKLDFSPMDLDILTQKDTKENNQLKGSVLSVFNEIALNFKYMIMNKENNLVGIISSIKGEGKSTISNYLAVALARNNTKVLLVDADFYNPRVSRYYDFKNLPGFSEVVTEQVDLEDAIIETRFENLFILPSGKLPPSVNKLYHSDKFGDYVKAIKSFADIVIIDTPAYMYFPETSVLVSHLDYTLLTAKINTTTLKSINRIIRKLSMVNTVCSGFIANGIVKDIFDTAYYDYYSYSYEYYYYTLEDGTKKKKKRLKHTADEYDDESSNNIDNSVKNALPSKKSYKNVKKKNALTKSKDIIKDFLGLSDYIDIEDDDYDEI
jgi:capsular exopolysaccharide synthesis family protein